jgi:hypothetical protein
LQGRGNVSDVAAKDGSQETLVNLTALVLGYFLMPLVLAHAWTWPVVALLVSLHM